MSNPDNIEDNNIRTYINFAWIFSILIVVVWAILFVYNFVSFFMAMGNPYYQPFGNFFIWFDLVYGIVYLVMAIPSVLVFRRINRMKSAVNQGDMEKLKKLNTMGWAIISLIFAGVIPGIMLLLVNSQLSSPRASSTGGVSSDNLDKMVKLKSMLDSGVITKEEFESQKDRLLNPKAKQTSNVEDKLTKLKSLYDSGTLTESEYNEQKKKLLSDL